MVLFLGTWRCGCEPSCGNPHPTQALDREGAKEPITFIAGERKNSEARI